MMNLLQLFRFRGRSTARIDAIMAVLAFLLLLYLWDEVVKQGWTSPRFLPSPWGVFAALYGMIVGTDFVLDVWISVARVGVAFLLSVIIAVPMGIWMSSYRIVGTLTEPLIDFIRYLPVPALVPLLIIWFGIEETSKIAVLWVGTFFQLVLLIADDARRVPNEFVEIGYTLGARPRQIVRDIILRAMMPNMVDNLRITLGWCWTYLIVAEIVAANSGIGHVIWSSRRLNKVPEVMAGILVVGIIGLITDQLIRLAHRRWFRYL